MDWRKTRIILQTSAPSVYDVQTGRGVPSEYSIYMEYFAISFFATYMYMYISIVMQKYVFLLICKVNTVFFFFLLFHSRRTIVAENVQNTLARLTYFGFVLFCLNSTNKLSTLLNNDTFNFLLLVYEILFPSMLCDVC